MNDTLTFKVLWLKYIVLISKVILDITVIVLEKVQQNKTKVIDNFHLIIKRQETGLTRSICFKQAHHIFMTALYEDSFVFQIICGSGKYLVNSLVRILYTFIAKASCIVLCGTL